MMGMCVHMCVLLIQQLFSETKDYVGTLQRETQCVHNLHFAKQLLMAASVLV